MSRVPCLFAVRVAVCLLLVLASAGAALPELPFVPAGRDATGQPVEVLRTDLHLEAAQRIAYPGTQPQTREEFPVGFPRAMGSGICFKGVVENQLEFWVLGDRGPNADAPEFDGREGKIFVVPGFTPAFGLLRIGRDGTVLRAVTDLSDQSGHRLSGLPLPDDALHGIPERALSEELKPIAPDPRGIDPEAIACDGPNLWISDEYGPIVAKIDPGTGRLIERRVPGDGLPAVWADRRVNRGMELLAYDRDSGHLWGALQSVIDAGSVNRDATSVPVRHAARFIRWLEIDPATPTVRQFAYPVDPAAYHRGDTGEAKLGDMTALGHGHFAVIEQGIDGDGRLAHYLFVVDASAATDIDRRGGADLERSSVLGRPYHGADWHTVAPLQKRLLLDLSRIGWTAEKAEGLALVDERTLALTNDNDYGVESALLDGKGRRMSGQVEKCRWSAQAGTNLSGPKCPPGAAAVGMFRLPDEALGQHVWLIRFAQPLRAY